MRKLWFILFGVAGFIFSTVHGDENKISTVSLFKEVNTNHPNYFSFSPETFLVDLDLHFKDVKVKGAKFFLGVGLNYEYLKPDTFYFGINLISAGGNKGFDNSYRNRHLPKSGGLTGFGSVEMRMGYTFSPNKWLIASFLGIGGV